MARFTRVKMKGLIRKRKRISQPGQPPSGHAGFLKAGIVYSHDRANKSAVIGVMKRSSSRAAKALDKGGRSVVRNNAGQKVTVTIQARPFSRKGLALGLEAFNLKQMKGKL